MNAKDRSELLTKIHDWICKYHNEFDNKGFDWTPNICADVWYEIAKRPVKNTETILCNITIRDRDLAKPSLLLILFRDDDFVITQPTVTCTELYTYLVPRIKIFLLSRDGNEFNCEGAQHGKK